MLCSLFIIGNNCSLSVCPLDFELMIIRVKIKNILLISKVKRVMVCSSTLSALHFSITVREMNPKDDDDAVEPSHYLRLF